ncbi:hypothetical protein G7Y89_g12840 [Cudoniella acicularis]|uniref:Uncharacterized protein n=1 Tax=Cudoniella acicularis TaxID=354080 RepID=A0A8H4RAS1_9HELO|nr:hypothetical protein G7Y89_g12840 [Cudoniella acicularis]
MDLRGATATSKATATRPRIVLKGLKVRARLQSQWKMGLCWGAITAGDQFKHTAGSFPDIKKIQSLAVEISSDKDLETVLVDIKPLSPCNLREIILVIGHEEPLVEFKCVEHSRLIALMPVAVLPTIGWRLLQPLPTVLES